jgi:hypothetical protein
MVNGGLYSSLQNELQLLSNEAKRKFVPVKEVMLGGEGEGRKYPLAFQWSRLTGDIFLFVGCRGAFAPYKTK